MGSKGVKWGSKMDFFHYISKSLHLYFQTFYMLLEANSALLLAKTACLSKFWFLRYGVKRGQPGSKMDFFHYISKSLHLFFRYSTNNLCVSVRVLTIIQVTWLLNYLFTLCVHLIIWIIINYSIASILLSIFFIFLSVFLSFSFFLVCFVSASPTSRLLVFVSGQQHL